MNPERFSEESCPPEVRGYIARMEEFMNEPQYNHSGVPTQVAVDLWRRGQINSFAQFEGYLREMNSRVHFLAVPHDFYGNQYNTVYPLEEVREKPQYTLYVAVNGAEEAAQMRERLALTAEENARRLKTTGVLTIKK